jgi:hypothetical protein
MPINQLTLFEPDFSPAPPYCWYGTIADFLMLAPDDWLTAMAENYQQLYRQRAAATQRQAWTDCAQVLRSQLQPLVGLRSESAAWTLVFEYELPGEGGRRPDLVLLAAGTIVVFEFKQKSTAAPADLDQVAAYARDLQDYHSGSAGHPIRAIVLPTQRTQPTEQRDAVTMLNLNDLTDYLSQLEVSFPAIAATAWLQGEYAPLPSIVQAARRIFQQEPLPSIKRAESAGIPDLLTYLAQLLATAQRNHTRHLVLITGVPGAGKTLVGLQFVYQQPTPVGSSRQAVFLSGNDPLVSVLQYALKSRAFVQSIRNFYLDHEVRRQKGPREHVFVFDEAQRAWDRERMTEKYGLTSAAAGVVLRIAARSPDWCVLLGLIGEGQEIHVGEEEGLEQWNVGLTATQARWQVHCAPEHAHHFTAIDPSDRHCANFFNLTTSLRSHRASDLQAWVADLLAGNLEAAAAIFTRLNGAGFAAYLTRDLETAKAYCRDRYQFQPDKRYGLLASSRARNLTAYGINNDYMATQRLKVGPWYIDPPDSPLSCCALESVATEFSCQGLELDLPIVGWGNDLIWRETSWASHVRPKNVRDPLRLRLNSYRVLLTRGRDGFIVFVPPDPKMDGSFAALRDSGLRSL